MRDETDLLLLTPGPLTTTSSVKAAMLRDVSTWDREYFSICQSIRSELVRLAVGDADRRDDHTAVLVQGSGTFAVEATLGSAIPPDGRLLVASNGAYGVRMVEIARRLGIDHVEIHHEETQPLDLARIESTLDADPGITHVAAVHCETTTGMLNEVGALGDVVRRTARSLILDSMSAFGGVPFDMADVGADYVISSSNKCIQGVPGFAFVIARVDRLDETAGWARSLVLDLHDQWKELDAKGGKWRYTSPTHVILAFAQALEELSEEGGIEARFRRYGENQETLMAGMEELGFVALLPSGIRSPIITSFVQPDHELFSFERFFEELRARGFMIYPGKVSQAETFRIGSIGDVHPGDITRLLGAIAEVKDEMGFV